MSECDDFEKNDIKDIDVLWCHTNGKRCRSGTKTILVFSARAFSESLFSAFCAVKERRFNICRGNSRFKVVPAEGKKSIASLFATYSLLLIRNYIIYNKRKKEYMKTPEKKRENSIFLFTIFFLISRNEHALKIFENID